MAPSVLHVIDSLSPTGGAEVSTAQLVEALAAAGLRQGLVALRGPEGDASKALREAGVVVRVVDAAGAVAAVRAVRSAVREVKPDLLHSVLWQANQAARLAGLLERVPVVSSVVNVPDGDRRLPPGTAWKSRVAGYVDAVTARRLTVGFHALTHVASRFAVQSWGVPAEAVSVVPRARARSSLGEPGPLRRGAVRRSLGIDQHVPIVLNVARQEPQKGQVLLLRAFAELRARRPAAVLLVAGKPGRSTPELRGEHARLGLGEAVRFLGHRQDVPDLLAAADVFVSSALWEGFGGAVLEAMAMEVPVVAFGAPAVVEVVDGCGRLAPVGDVTQLAAGLAEVLADVADGADSGTRDRVRAGRVRADRDCAMEQVAERMIAFYHRHSRPAGVL